MHLPAGGASSKLACKAAGKYRVWSMELSVHLKAYGLFSTSIFFSPLQQLAVLMPISASSSIRHSLENGRTSSLSFSLSFYSSTLPRLSSCNRQTKTTPVKVRGNNTAENWTEKVTENCGWLVEMQRRTTIQLNLFFSSLFPSGRGAIRRVRFYGRNMRSTDLGKLSLLSKSTPTTTTITPNPDSVFYDY